MGPALAKGELKRFFSKGELQTFVTVGYNLDPVFVAANPNLIPNSTPYSTKMAGYTNYMVDNFPDIVPADFTMINNVGNSITINLSADATLVDNNGDAISVAPNSLYNIRGCGIGGNNHNCLALSSNSQQIVYTPRPGFYGRAQFGFNLHDGKEAGGYTIYTIDVAKGNNNPNCTAGANMVLNGDFEEGTEIKRLGIEESLPNDFYSYEITREGRFRRGTVFGDNQRLNYSNVNAFGSWPNAYGHILVNNSYINCNGTTFNSDIYSPSFPSPFSSTFPLNALSNGGQRYYDLHLGYYHNFDLCADMQPCRSYNLEFDYYATNAPFSAGGPLTFTVSFTNTTSITYNTAWPNPIPSNYQFTITLNSLNGNWQHVSIPFTYCGTNPSEVLNIAQGVVWSTFYIDNLSITENLNPQPVLSAAINSSTNTICQGSSVTLSATATNTLCSQSFNWMPGNLSGSSINVSPTVNTTYTLTVNDGCRTATTVTTVTVIPTPIISAVASPTAVCTSSPNTTLTASGGTSYVWNPGSITGNPITVSPLATTIYTVTGTAANGCTGTNTVQVTYTTCILTCTNCIPTATTGLVVNGNLTNNAFCISNNVTITGNVNIIGSELKMAPNVLITIAPTGNLNIINSHLYSCIDMWKGIVIQDGGKLSIRSSMVEDAIVAVDITNNTQTSNVLNVTASTFNKNQTGVYINSYTQLITTFPFTITNSIFTCRDIPFVPNSLVFPSASVVGAPATNPGAPLSNAVISNATYLETGLGATLKAPFAGAKSSVGLKLYKVGGTLNAQTTAPTYYEFKIGNIAGNNIFDNQRVCVDIENSNFTSVNNIYQNPARYGKGSSQGGIGINANATVTDNYRLQVIPAVSTIGGNKFVDCSRAINSINYFEHKITYCDFRSQQVNSAPVNFINHVGLIGVYINTNRYRVCNVSDNSLYNIESGLTMIANFGPLAITGIPAYAQQYAGAVNFDRNTIRPHVVGFPVTTQYIANAIQLQNILGGGLYFANSLTPIIQAANNNITSAYRGIAYSNWQKQNIICNSNNITLVNDPYNVTGPPIQYGIGSSNCGPFTIAGNSIRGNVVTGFGFSNPNAKGIVQNINNNTIVNCNTTSNVNNGIEFAGNNPSTNFTKNSMSNSNYGYVLSNNGIIGQQGNSTTPQDNQWTGSWIGGNVKTGILTGSDATNSKMYIRTSATSPFNPNGSSQSTTPNTFFTQYSIANGNLIPTTSNPINLGCPIVVNPNNPPPNSIQALITHLEQIVLDLVSYQANAVQAKIINKNQAYRLLKADPSLMVGSPVLQTFYSNSQTTTRKIFDDVETDIIAGNVVSAAGMNAAVSPTNAIESNYKDFYNMAVKNAQGNLTDADSLALATIAYGCPFTDGVMVYQARALLNSLYMMYQEYPDNCNTAQGSRLMKNEEDVSNITNGFDVVLFPNPGANNFSIATFGLTEGEIDISINDVTGKIVYQNKQQIINALTQFDIDVKSGVYFVKIINPNSKEVLIKKLIIQK